MDFCLYFKSNLLLFTVEDVQLTEGFMCDDMQFELR